MNAYHRVSMSAGCIQTSFCTNVPLQIAPLLCLSFKKGVHLEIFEKSCDNKNESTNTRGLERHAVKCISHANGGQAAAVTRSWRWRTSQMSPGWWWRTHASTLQRDSPMITTEVLHKSSCATYGSKLTVVQIVLLLNPLKAQRKRSKFCPINWDSQERGRSFLCWYHLAKNSWWSKGLKIRFHLGLPPLPVFQLLG